MKTPVPIQRRDTRMLRALKWFLHTKPGAFIGYHLGIAGFNRVQTIHRKFLGWADEMNIVPGGTILPVGMTGRMGVYAAPKMGFCYNSRVSKGAALTSSLLSGSSLGSISSPLPPLYIALSTSSLTPANGDTTLSGETSVAGLGRALGTAGSYSAPGSLDAACSYVVTKTFTLTGSNTTIVSAALFDASSSGNLFVEANLSSSAAMATNDQLTINWTVNN